MTYDELKEQIKDAMKAKDKVRLSILRQVHGELKNIEVDERREVTDADNMAIADEFFSKYGEKEEKV